MNLTAEEKIVQQIAEKRGQNIQPEKGLLKQFSPSQKPLLFGGALVLGIALFSLLFFSQPQVQRSQQASLEQQMLVAKFLPKEEITPEYIDSLGDAQERSFAEKQQQQDAQKNSPPSKTPPAIEPSKPLVATASMLLFSANKNGGGNMSLPLGTEISAELEKTVIADDRSVPVVARLHQDVKHGDEIIFPRNSRAFGTTQGMVEDRVHVFFSRIVFPNGEEHPFSGIALDEQGIGGIQGKVKKKPIKRGKGILSSALLGASTVFAPAGVGFEDMAMRGAQQGSLRELSRDGQYYQRTEAMPIVTLRAETPFVIMVEQH